jgi:hypothetical protein
MNGATLHEIFSAELFFHDVISLEYGVATLTKQYIERDVMHEM